MTANDEHPLVRHIQSLSTALNNQHHHALTAHQAQSQSHLLSRQISILEHELSTLRATPLPQSTESTIKINQLSLALRTLNDKLDTTEHVLVERTRQLDHALADVSMAKASMDAAYDVAARLHAKNQELHTKLRMEEEKMRMSERVIQDYADLVRKLEGRRSSIPISITRNDEQLATLEKTQLQSRLSNCQHELSVLQIRLETQTKTNSDLISQLSQLQVDMDKRDRDDDTASKMVSRYMKFSQQSTNALQTTLTSLQHRHTTTLTSYTSQIQYLHHQIQTLTSLDDQLRYQLSKEHFGRRWETRMRLQLVRREERFVEDLKRWLRRSEERFMREDEDEDDKKKMCMMDMIQDAKIIIDQLDTPIHIDIDEQQPISGSLARIIMMQSTILDLLDRLKDEQERRLDLEEWVGSRDFKEKEEGNDQVESVVKQSKGDQDVVVSPLKPITDLYGERIYPILGESTTSQDTFVEWVKEVVVEKEADTALDVVSSSPPSLLGESITSHDTIVEQVDRVKEVMVEQDVEKETDTALDVPPPPPPPPSHPLLKSLHESRNRYTHIQHSFHNCHIALEQLKSHLTSSSSSSSPTDNLLLPFDALRIIVQRLDDYTEDIRVELEIRVLDEDVLGRGYETLLMCSPSPSGGEGRWNEEEVLAFVNGTDPIIRKALKGFEKKLRDLEEDVGVIKKVVYHSFDNDDENGKEEQKISTTTKESLSTETLVASPPTSGWMTSWISSPSTRSITPSPSQQGSSILRRTVSSLGLSPSPSSSSSSHNGVVHSKMSTGEVIKNLQLKTPMPELVATTLVHEQSAFKKDSEEGGMLTMPNTFSRFGSPVAAVTAAVTSRTRSSFAIGMGVVGGGGGHRGSGRGEGMLRSAMIGDVGRRRVVSAVAVTNTAAGVMEISKKMGEGDVGEDVD